MEEKPGQPQPQPPPPPQSQQPPQHSSSSSHSHQHHPHHHHPQQQPQQQQPPQAAPAPPPHHHHHHHYYYYNHNHHHHHQHHQQPHQYLQHGPDSSSPKAQPKPLRHEPKHALQPHQEAPKKKTGYGELNGNAGEREILKSLGSDEATNTISRVLNGNQQAIDTNLNPKQTVKASTFGKAGIKTKNFIQKNSMDKKNEKSYESKPRDNQSIDKADAVSIPNGVVTNNSGYITNGYVGRGADNDGSGSESGYTTPKKRKARRNSAKGCENLNLVQDKIMQPESNTPNFKQGLDNFKPDYSEQKGNRGDSSKPIWKYEAGSGGAGRGKPGVGDTQRKNSDAKPGGSSKKFDDRPKIKHATAVASKEDSWTLFKPPPVFPVDNSSAKIVPKISYASKVKENLHKAAQSPSVSPLSLSSSPSAGEAQAQTSSRLSQVPMSAMKAVTSANFSNGPVLAGTEGSLYSPGNQPLLTTAASTVTPTPSGTETILQDLSITSAAVEQMKPSLFIYPSNMQTVLLGAAQVDLPSQTEQQNLGDIFQNQWGLSFINEPSAGPETVIGKSTDHQVMEVTFQGEYPATLVSQGAEIIPSGTEHPVFPKAYELDKRTSPQVLGGILRPGTASEGGALTLEPSLTGDLQKADISSHGALVFLSKDYEIENPLASPTNTLLASAKEQRYQRGLERKDSWGSFDPRAAIVYHTKEMESIWNLQKQDPQRIITYDEAMDSPDQ